MQGPNPHLLPVPVLALSLAVAELDRLIAHHTAAAVGSDPPASCGQFRRLAELKILLICENTEKMYGQAKIYKAT